jgi:signal transduction histidine kinase
MLSNSRVPVRMPSPTRFPPIQSIRGHPPLGTASWGFVIGAALGVGLVSFLTTELMHHWLVPDLGSHRERLLAEALSALIVSCLIAKLARMARQQQRPTIARMQVISEMNHHIRNALAPIALSVDAIENQQLIRIISDGVDRIDWALREILPRELPLTKDERYRPDSFKKGT